MENERLGEENYNNFGTLMKIVEYKNAKDIIVEFQDEHKIKIHTRYGDFKRGKIKNLYDKSVYGVGYVGEGKYKSRVNGKITEVYNTWCNMLKRCYDPYYLNKCPTYIDCYVCKEWHNFQTFAKWFYKNYYEIEGERMELDKDILCKGNKIYSPDTCILVNNRINLLFVKNDKLRGEYPIGVCWYKSKNKFRAYCKILDKKNNKQIYLGLYNTVEEAFLAYKNFKENYIKQIADEYYSKGLIPTKLYDAMYKYEVEIND